MSSNFNNLDLESPQQTCENLEKNGFTIAGTIAKATIDEILKTHTEENYRNPHIKSSLIHDILHCEKFYHSIKAYLGVEPILYSSSIWTRQDDSAKSAKTCQKEFHYDVGDYKTVTLFIYLSDVDCLSSPHVVIQKTHKLKCYQRIFTRFLSSKKANDKFKDDIIPLCAEAGTIIFENLSCYHKRSSGSKKRVLLTATYHLKRNISLSYNKNKALFYKYVYKL